MKDIAYIFECNFLKKNEEKKIAFRIASLPVLFRNAEISPNV
jgi:hypothetical protein